MASKKKSGDISWTWKNFLILLDFVVGLFFTQTVHEFSRIHEWEGFNSSIRGLFADGFRAKPQIPLEPGIFKSRLQDKRLNKRCQKIASDLEQQSTDPINQACEDWADTKAAYRFCDNPKVAPDKIISAHSGRTVRRMKKHVLVLVIQDTTFLGSGYFVSDANFQVCN